MIRLIAAVDSRRGIATDSGIPWTLPGDSAYFREKTAHGLIVIGRATYDEFAAPLHGRENFVFSNASAPLRSGFEAIGSLDQLCAAHPGDDVWVIGGAGVYAETIGHAHQLLLTQVTGDFGCTKFFPPYEDAFSLESQSAEHQETGIGYRFETWSRSSPEGDTSREALSARRASAHDVGGHGGAIRSFLWPSSPTVAS